MKVLKCFVVTTEAKADCPLYVAVDLDITRSFQRAKAFVLGYNSVHETGRTVIRRGEASLTWQRRKSVPLRSAG